MRRVFVLLVGLYLLALSGGGAWGFWSQQPGIPAGGSATPSGPAGGDLSGTYPNPTVVGGTNLTGVIGKVNAQGVIGNAGTLSSDLSLGNIVTATVGGGAYTIAKPTNGAANATYYLVITSTADVAGTYASGWLTGTTAAGLALPGANNSGAANTIQTVPFMFDGSNYQIMNWADLYARRGVISTLTVGSVASTLSAGANNFTSTTGLHSATAGGFHTGTGGTAPTLTAGCNGAGVTTITGTNQHGHFTTQTAAATTCTITWSAAATWPYSPDCYFYDDAATITPAAFSTGACGTSTCVVDFASVAAKSIGYICM